ncbi:hypothetical protein evm_003442 [Chilo suppressalis]|nr:hypothetical protein evm_003442 [Chilo suppressalis]
MANNVVKRERSANFNSDERDLLVTLVQKYRNIIENKQSDGVTWKKKEFAWKQIEKDFNAQSGAIFRSSKTLRIKYECLKRTVRKKSAALRTELYRTGGGPNTATPLDSTEIYLKSLISLSTDGLESVYDSDVLPPVQNEEDGPKLSMEDYVVLPSASKDLEFVTVTDSHFDDETELTLQNPIILQENEISTDEILSPPLTKINDEPLLERQNKNEKTIKKKIATENFCNMINSDNELENIPCGTTPPSNKKWDVTSRRNLRTKKHPALIVNTPNEGKKTFDLLTEKKLELVQLQKELLQAEIIEKKKEWEFNEKERQWKEEEYQLKLAKLRKELND